MKCEDVTYVRCSTLVSEWMSRRLPQRPRTDALLDDQCDMLCQRLAEDLECDFADVSEDTLAHLKAKLAFFMATCSVRREDVMFNTPKTSADDLLQAIFLTLIRGMKLPREWRYR